MNTYAQTVCNRQFIDPTRIVESRIEPVEELDMIHKLWDGSFVYEENWLDIDDENSRPKIYQRFFTTTTFEFHRFERSF